MEKIVGVLVRMPEPFRDQLAKRAEREKRSTNAEILVMLEWAIRNMPEQLQDSDRLPPPAPASG